MIEQKQAFLRSQILEAGYNENEFVEFMADYKENWEDLSKWSFQELKDIVAKFRAKFIPVPSGATTAPSPAPPPVEAKPEKPVFFQYYRTAEQPLDKKVKVQPSFRRGKNSNVTVEVKKAELQSYGGSIMGIGQTTQYFYTIRIAELGYEVIRKHSDLLWLREKFVSLYPYQYVPMLKKYKKTRGDERERSKRARMVVYFVQELVSIPNLFNTKLFEGFFKNAEKGKFDNYKRGVEATHFTKTLATVSNETGQVRCRITNGAVQFTDQVSKLIAKQVVSFQNIQRMSLSLTQNFGRVAKDLFALSSLFSGVNASFANFNGVVSESRNEQPCSVFSTLGVSFMEWAKQMESFGQCMPTMIRHMTKNCKHQELALEQFHKRIGTTKDQYFKAKTQLLVKKERLFESKNIRSWELPESAMIEAEKDKANILANKAQAMRLICPKESRQVDDLRDWFALMNEKGVECGAGVISRMSCLLRSQLIKLADLSRHKVQAQLQALLPLKQVK